MGLLNSINGPDDLKRLAQGDLPALAGEIRNFIINNVSVTGGHLAPSLGAIELIVALHYIYNSPRDRIIFDTGHQAYAHKIICGRRGEFGSLRQYGGISGFIRPAESEHDCFEVGHASTSIAAAMGFARSDLLKGEHRNTIAVIGDGALTGGLALAALNNAEVGTERLMVILNDNGMSISPNVGRVSRTLSLLRQRSDVRWINQLIKDVVKKTPIGGKTLEEAWQRLKQALLYFVSPATRRAIFEAWGLKYFGPYDGHDIKGLVRILRQLKKIDGPIFIHVRTVKGKGYEPAENEPAMWHGVSGFDKINGKFQKKSSVKTYTNIFAETLTELAHEDKRIVAITAAMSQGTGLEHFQAHFPERFFDVGIAEDFAVTFAAGCAKNGLRPVAAIYSTFLQRAFDQLIHDVGIQNIPVVFALDRAGLVGADGATHHGYFDISYLSLIPNFVVMAPSNEDELRHMLYTAILHESGPIAFRFPRGNALGVPLSEKPVELPIGSWNTVREGNDCYVLAAGSMVKTACEAADALAERGMELNVVNARFIKPMDAGFLSHISRKGLPVVTVEENVLRGGLGEAVLGWLNDNAKSIPPVLRLTLPDRFVLHGAQDALLAEVGLDSASVEIRIESWVKSLSQVRRASVT